MGKILNLFSQLATPKTEEPKLRFHIDDPLVIVKMSNSMIDLINKSPLNKDLVILCIGTDRSTGDSLGPLTGWRLKNLLRNSGIKVYGTVDDPVHAVNLQEKLDEIKNHYKDPLIIAIDACLGKVSNVGTILLQNEALRPGAGVNKNLPAVGDISISGIVNVGGFMEFQVLQNTRLSLVLNMSQTIANSVYLALRRTLPKEKVN